MDRLYRTPEHWQFRYQDVVRIADTVVGGVNPDFVTTFDAPPSHTPIVVANVTLVIGAGTFTVTVNESVNVIAAGSEAGAIMPKAAPVAVTVRGVVPVVPRAAAVTVTDPDG